MIKKILKIAIFLTILIIPNSKIFACNNIDNFISGEAITNSRNNIRIVPCRGTKILGQTKIGEKFEVIAEAGEYFKVIINGEERYIWKEGVDFKERLTPTQAKHKKIFNKIIKKTENFDIKKIMKFRNALIMIKRGSDYNDLIQKLIKNYNKKISIYFEELENKSLDRQIGEYWLSLYNNERRKLGLKEYQYDERLQNSAKIWAKTSANRGYYSHKRDVGDVYYDFWKIQNWFKNNGVNCKVENRTAAVENIGYGILYCKSGDCFGNLKKTVKTTFDNYLKEKGKANAAHYNSIVSPYLNYMGFGIYKKPIGNNRYGVYNVTHFCTNF